MSDDHHDDHHHHSPYPALPDKVSATREQLDALHIPNQWRDECVDYLALLRQCRTKEGSFPTSCHHEKHGWEHCQWDRHKMKFDKLKAQKTPQTAAEEAHH